VASIAAESIQRAREKQSKWGTETPSSLENVPLPLGDDGTKSVVR
jgi:hypothetical protein